MIPTPFEMHIDIFNDPEVLLLILETIPYIPGWKIANNVAINMKQAKSKKAQGAWTKTDNLTPRFFVFDFNEKEFEWDKEDYEGDGNETSVDSTAKASAMMEYVYKTSFDRDVARIMHVARVDNLKLATIYLNKEPYLATIKADGGYTPMHMAAAYDGIEIIDLLLQHGADINALDEHGRTPIMWSNTYSKGGNKEETIKWLVQHNAKS